MLSKTELTAEISEMTGVGRHLIKNILDAMAEVAEDEIKEGNDFTVPGVCRVYWLYTAPAKKGERYQKGDTYASFGGEKVAETDSPARKANVRLKAAPTGAVGRAAPKKNDRSRFLQTRAGKAIAARKR